ncbi:hypothetical protein GCM10028862_09510 [Luteimonas pelagia]
MYLLYTPSYSSAHQFALHNELMPGDWKWISDKDVVRKNSRADVYIGPDWQRHPHRAEIDEALQVAVAKRRLGTVTDLSSSFGTLGVSGA